MQSISTIGLDIAKSVFQLHGVDAAGQVVIRRQLRRRHVLAFFQKLPPCLVGIEACASSHHWSRELQSLGHAVRLMPPAYVKPYVKRQKNDITDAEAICEAVTRPNMRFVPTKTVEQQSCLMLHRVRHLFIRQQTAVINSIRAYLAEFGIVAPVGRRGVEQLLEVVADTADCRLPEVGRACLAALGSQLRALKAQILEFDRRIIAWHRSSTTSKRLDAIPGVGPALATALVASIADPKAFRSGRDFSAWVGLVPKQNSSGGKDKLGSISKQGGRYLRSLFTAGALAVIRYAKIHGTGHRPWLTRLLARRPTKVAARIEPHVTVFDKSARKDGTFSREDFNYDQTKDVYICPDGKPLTTTGTRVNDGNTLLYRASLRSRCCPSTPARKVPRSIHEHARDTAPS
jgi:transposase